MSGICGEFSIGTFGTTINLGLISDWRRIVRGRGPLSHQSSGQSARNRWSADCIIGIFDWLLDAECPLTLLDQLGIRLPRTTGDSSKPLLNQTRRSTIFGSRTVCSPNQAIGTLFFGSDDINRRDNRRYEIPGPIQRCTKD